MHISISAYKLPGHNVKIHTTLPRRPKHPENSLSIQTMKLAASRALITARKGLCQKVPQPPAVQSKMAKNPLYDHEAAVFTAQDAVTG